MPKYKGLKNGEGEDLAQRNSGLMVSLLLKNNLERPQRRGLAMSTVCPGRPSVWLTVVYASKWRAHVLLTSREAQLNALVG